MTTSPQTTVITGATSGVGTPLAIGLARAGHRLILGARDPERAERTTRAVRAAVPGAGVEHRPLDLSSLDSVRTFAEQLPADALDRLVLNAGVMTVERRLTGDGFEMMLGTNALGHFALTGRLVGRLALAPDPRIVTQSSESHRSGRIDLEDLMHERSFSSVQAYHDSKQAQHLLAVELDRRLDGIESVVAQPGWVVSGLGREVFATGPWAFRVVMAAGDRLIGRRPEEGARAAIRATLETGMPGAATGRYMTPSRLRRLRGNPHLDDVAPRVMDPVLGAELWTAAVALTGVDPSAGRVVREERPVRSAASP